MTDLYCLYFHEKLSSYVFFVSQNVKWDIIFILFLKLYLNLSVTSDFPSHMVIWLSLVTVQNLLKKRNKIK